MGRPMAFSLLKKHVGNVFRAGPLGALNMKSTSMTTGKPASGLTFESPAARMRPESPKAALAAPVRGTEPEAVRAYEELSLTEALARLETRIQSLDEMQRRLSFVMAEVSVSLRRI
jgi:hypothetical protein